MDAFSIVALVLLVVSCVVAIFRRQPRGVVPRLRTLDGAHCLRWPPSEIPVQLLVDCGLPLRWQATCQLAAIRINKAARLRLIEPIPALLPPPGFPADEAVPKGFVLLRVEDDGARLEDDKRAGVADVRWDESSGLIGAAVVTLPSESTFALQIVLHEFGHVLGLDHSALEGSMMLPYLSGRPMVVAPSRFEADALRRIYGGRRA